MQLQAAKRHKNGACSFKPRSGARMQPRARALGEKWNITSSEGAKEPLRHSFQPGIAGTPCTELFRRPREVPQGLKPVTKFTVVCRPEGLLHPKASPRSSEPRSNHPAPR